MLFVRLVCDCLDLSISSSSWCLGNAAVCDCGTPWTFLLPFFFRRILRCWARKWGMRFQPVKCNIMYITRKRTNKIKASYTLEGMVLKNVDSRSDNHT